MKVIRVPSSRSRLGYVRFRGATFETTNETTRLWRNCFATLIAQPPSEARCVIGAFEHRPSSSWGTRPARRRTAPAYGRRATERSRSRSSVRRRCVEAIRHAERGRPRPPVRTGWARVTRPNAARSFRQRFRTGWLAPSATPRSFSVAGARRRVTRTSRVSARPRRVTSCCVRCSIYFYSVHE